MADETSTDTVTDLADLKTIAGDAPEGDAATIAVATAPLREQELDKQGRAYATGRRKDAVARVWVKPGSGKITVNGKDQETYFARPTLRLIINQPFGITDRAGQYDVVATVKGGGLSGQAGAVKHGIAQALSKYEPALRSTVKAAGFLTRDSRVPGQGAPQLPVLQALIPAISLLRGGGPAGPPFLFGGSGFACSAAEITVLDRDRSAAIDPHHVE